MNTTYITLTNIKAVIFDMDGTMVNNMPYHDLAWQKFLKKYGIKMTKKERMKNISSRRNFEIFGTLFGSDTPQDVRGAYAEEKESIYRDLYAKNIKEIAGLTNFLKQLKKLRLKIAKATTSPEKNRNSVLKSLKLVGLFDVIVGSEDVTAGKPDPQIYFETAKRLGVSPEQCIVFEDSPHGVTSAVNAGIRVIGLGATHSKKDLTGAENVINHFTQIELHE